MWRSAVQNHLTEGIIPFWKALRDNENGGYFGFMGYDLKVDPHAEKGCILNSRILWFFSECYLTLQDQSLLEEARHGFTFMKQYCFDKEEGGVYWSLTDKGFPLDTTKHTYNQAFALYALSTFFDASHDTEALELADELFDLIENRMRDEEGYLEAFSRNFGPALNDKLSENGVMADRTMNTALHVLEAYTEYLRVLKKYSEKTAPEKIQNVGEKLRQLLEIFKTRIYDPDKMRLEVFFDRDYHTLIDLYSYGHDIEAAWLLNRAADVLGDPVYASDILKISDEICRQIDKTALTDSGIPAEDECGMVKQERVWWVQAEGVNGFLDHALRFGNDSNSLKAAESIWSFIEKNVIDPRKGSEWFEEVHPDGSPYEGRPMVQPWKCPYHNGRMCLNVINWIK